MRHRWLAILLLVGTVFCSASLAEPPRGGASSGAWASLDSWIPDWPAPAEPSFVKTTRVSLGRAWNGTKRTTRSAWESTKHALRPYDAPTKRSRRSAEDEGGFWANLFGGSEAPTEPTTVNDFLKQPTPY